MNNARIQSRLSVWLIWVVASFFYAYQYVLRVMPNVLLADIMEHFHIQAALFGQFSGIYYIGYCLMHLPIGMALDRYGPKKVVTSCLGLMIVGLLPLLFATHWAYPIMGRFLIGVGSSAAILGLFKIIRMIFDKNRFPRMLSLSVAIGIFGAIYGGGPMNYLKTSCGYQTVIQVLVAVGILLALISYWFFPQPEKASHSGTPLADIKAILSHRKILWSCIFAGLMVGPLEGFADVWGTLFLKQVYGFDSTLAASLPSMIFIGMGFGAPLLNMVAEKLGNYLVTIAGAGAIMTLAFLSLLCFHWTAGLLCINFIIIGIFSSYQILAIYKASTYVREESAGLATAVANMIIMLFGYLFHTIIGSVVAHSGGPLVSDALRAGVVVLPIALLIGTAGFTWLVMQERREQKQVESETR